MSFAQRDRGFRLSGRGRSYDVGRRSVKLGEALEKRVARDFGGRRRWWAIGDVETQDGLVIECKLRARIPKWLKEMVAQAKRTAGVDQPAVLILSENRDREIGCSGSLKGFFFRGGGDSSRSTRLVPRSPSKRG
jgi:hypothetical protein